MQRAAQVHDPSRSGNAATLRRVDHDAQRDEQELARNDALRRYELALAEANLAGTGTPQFREAMENVKRALREVEETEADGTR